jgi:Tfp pilus assembly protein PilF
MEKGDHEIAKKEFERVLQIDPDNRNALQALKSLNER